LDFEKLATFTQLECAPSRQEEGPFPLNLSDTTASYRSQPGGGLDLVNIAREILGRGSDPGIDSRSERSVVTSQMASTEEQSASGQPESPTSRFTAVNGKEPLVGLPVHSNGASRRGSDERSNGQPRITPPGQEKLTITTTTTQRDDWLPPSNGDRHSYQPQNLYSDPDESHKRKRSGSIELNSSSANSYHTHALPSSTKQTPTTAMAESDGPREDSLRPTPSIEQRDPYGSESQYRHFITSQEDNRDSIHGSDSWHSRQYAPQHMTSDEQLGEALQRASQSMDVQRGYTSPDDDRSANPYGPYRNDGREMSAQSDPKKRKRNFSNRTKTGCMTCRRRKKKCDESRPECKSL
jgi:hypothetical protein